MCGRTPQAVRDAEASGRLPKPKLNANGRRGGYSLAEVNAMRDAFGTRPWRSDSDESVILAMQKFLKVVSASQRWSPIRLNIWPLRAIESASSIVTAKPRPQRRLASIRTTILKPK